MELATVASFLAAGISLATLAVTTFFAGRRERLKWAREALAEAFYSYVDISYRAKDAALDHQLLLVDDASREQVDSSIIALQILRENMLDIQTKNTLLAPKATFERSQELRWRVNDLHEALHPDLPTERLGDLVRAVAAARTAFIGSAKRSLALPR